MLFRSGEEAADEAKAGADGAEAADGEDTKAALVTPQHTLDRKSVV